MPLITVRDLRKEFKVYQHREGFLGAIRNLASSEHSIVKAVDGISFDVDEGQIVGYVGPNGAGKSTTIKMLTGILVPTSGEIDVDGLVPYKSRKENARRMTSSTWPRPWQCAWPSRWRTPILRRPTGGG